MKEVCAVAVAPFVRSAYNYDRDKASFVSGLACLDDSRTKQSFADEADINTIVRQFGLTGKLPDDLRPATYGDFQGVFDFHSAMNSVALANEEFERLPSAIRYRFHNDPQAFVEYCSNPENLDGMREMGLAVKLNPDTEAMALVDEVKAEAAVGKET